MGGIDVIRQHRIEGLGDWWELVPDPKPDPRMGWTLADMAQFVPYSDPAGRARRWGPVLRVTQSVQADGEPRQRGANPT